MGRSKWRRLRNRVKREERFEATPETLAKLQPDPLHALLIGHGRGDAMLESAADEIRAVYMAVVRSLMRKGGLLEDRGGMPDIPGFLAFAHGETYLPWARALHRDTMEAVIDLVIDREPVRNGCEASAIIDALKDYGKRMLRRATYREGLDN